MICKRGVLKVNILAPSTYTVYTISATSDGSTFCVQADVLPAWKEEWRATTFWVGGRRLFCMHSAPIPVL